MYITNETLHKVVSLLGQVGASNSKFSDEAIAVLSFVTNEILINNKCSLDYDNPDNSTNNAEVR